MAHKSTQEANRVPVELHRSRTTIEKLTTGYLVSIGDYRHAKTTLNVQEDLVNTINKAIENLRSGQHINITLLIES